MEREIRYAHTEDGVTIAYTTFGAGPPVLYCPNHQLSMDSMLGAGKGVFMGDGVALRTRFTIFDYAGIGASQRDVTDFSLEAQVRTIEAVVAHLPDDEPFTLVGDIAGCHSAALYATRHADRVRRFACMLPVLPDPDLGDIAGDARRDWSGARRRWAGWAYPDGPVALQRWYGRAMRESIAAEVFAAYLEANAELDLRETYRRIPVPTLVYVHSWGRQRANALALASLVPDCRVVLRPDDPALSRPAAAILEFMGIDIGPPSDGTATEAPSSATVTILFADIVESTAAMDRMGNAAFRERSTVLETRIREAVLSHSGEAVAGRTLGDGVLATFPSASQGIAAALECAAAGGDVGLALHLGLHAGDVLRNEGNVHGLAVSLASRVSALTGPNEILVSGTVRDLARASSGVAFEDRGEHVLRGIDDPVRVWAVR
jgi:class 3 adenylate cyclase